MKIIDRHLFRTVLAPLLYILAAFLLIYVIYDLFDNMGDFVDGQTPFGQVVRYYLVLMPSALVQIVPITLLLAVLYSLSSLTKNNELTAMRASGISILRLMVPFITVGFLASIAVMAVNETVGPRAAYWCYKFVKQQTKNNPESVHVTELAFKKDSASRTWYVNKFDTRDFSMQGVEFIQYRPDGKSEERKVVAKEGYWMDGYWMFQDVVVQPYDTEGNPMGAPTTHLSMEMSELTEVPEDFMSWVKPPEFMSSTELLRYIRINTQLQKESIARKEVDLHFRLAQPWTCLIVTLIGIPFGTHTGRKGALAGILLSIGLFFCYYALMNLSLYAGKGLWIPAWLAGWSPNILFLGLGSFLIYRMR